MRKEDINYTRIAKDTAAIIMAGGRGSRLGAMTNRRAKPAIYFGGKFRIIDFSLSNCVNSSIKKIALITQYKAHSLIRHIQNGWSQFYPAHGEFLEILPASQMVDETMWYRGTADSIFQNIQIIKNYPCSYFVILAGDHVYKMDYAKMVAAHIENNADCTVSCIEVSEEEAREFGVMGVDRNNQITSFVEKAPQPPHIPDKPGRCLASMGIYVFKKDFLFEMLQIDNQIKESSHDFGKDIIPYCVQHHKALAFPYSQACVKSSSEAEDYWRDVGTVYSYWKSNLDLTLPVPPIDIYDMNWRLYTYQPQYPPAKFLYDDDNRRGGSYDSLVASGTVISGSRVVKSIISSKVKVNSFSTIEESILFPSVNIGRHCRISKAIIDSDCEIPPGTVIGEDEAADRERFIRTPEGITIVDKPHLKKLADS